MFDYDYIITGGGCAGLSLAGAMAHGPLHNKRVLVIDNESKHRNDKTWCFWSDDPTEVYSKHQINWQHLQVHTPRQSYEQQVAPFTYNLVNSLDYYQEKRNQITQMPHAERLLAEVNAINPIEGGVSVATDRGTYRSRFVFNSIVFPQAKDQKKGIYLQQHFCGWVVEMEQPVFDPQKMILMDFRVDQSQGVSFVYILPFSETKALVEFTVFSSHPWGKPAYAQAIRSYLTASFGKVPYQITHEETGVIPMTNHTFERYPMPGVMNLGTAAGLTKATTGYTFRRIQHDCQAIVQALSLTGSPYYDRKQQVRFNIYDNLLLYLIREEGSEVHHIFDRLFARNDFRKVLRFLDEETHLGEELYMMVRLPWAPFLRSIRDYYFRGNVKRNPLLKASPLLKPQKIQRVLQ